jgi:hypothetical protein
MWSIKFLRWCFIARRFTKLLRKWENFFSKDAVFQRFSEYRLKYSNELDKILIKNFRENLRASNLKMRQDLIITLKNRKVYIGALSEFYPDNPIDDKYISFLPMQSGYRKDTDLSFVIVSDYRKKFIKALLQSDPEKRAILIANLLTPVIIDKNEIITLGSVAKEDED